MSTELNFSQKIAICYTVCGPTYKLSTVEKLRNRVKADNIYYFVIADDRNYFKDVEDTDITIKELKEFYEEYPEIEPYEFFEEATDLKEYGDKFLKNNYVFPFSTMRFHIKMAHDMGITNVALLATDSDFRFELVNDELLEDKNKLYFAVSHWPPYESELVKIQVIADVIKDLWGIDAPVPKMVYDEAARFYVFDTLEFMNKFFRMYHELIIEIFKRNLMRQYFCGPVVYNEEVILAVLYSVLGISGVDPGKVGLFHVNHDLAKERPWTVGAGPWGSSV